MTGFFEILAARAVGASPALRPRPPQRFETATHSAPPWSGHPGSWLSTPWETTVTPRVASESGSGRELDSELETERVRPSAAEALTGETSRPRSSIGRAAPSAPPSPAGPAPDADDEGQDRAPEPSAPTRPDRPRRSVRRELRDRAGEAIEHLLGDDAQSAGRPGVDGAGASPSAVASAADDQTSATGPWQPSPAPEVVDAPAPVDRAPRPVIQAHDEPARRGRPPATSRPGPAQEPQVDLAALLREEVYGALAARGDVPPRERPVVLLPGSRAAAAQPGRATIRADGVSTSRPDTPLPAPGGHQAAATPTVNLHIDRVSVTRAAPPAPAAAPPARSPVDHAAYLARRRGQG